MVFIILCYRDGRRCFLRCITWNYLIAWQRWREHRSQHHGTGKAERDFSQNQYGQRIKPLDVIDLFCRSLFLMLRFVFVFQLELSWMGQPFFPKTEYLSSRRKVLGNVIRWNADHLERNFCLRVCSTVRHFALNYLHRRNDFSANCFPVARVLGAFIALNCPGIVRAIQRWKIRILSVDSWVSSSRPYQAFFLND